MAIFYELKTGGKTRLYITENEAKTAASEIGGEIAKIEIDEIEVRNWAAKWRNWCEIKSETAKLREAKKSKSEKAEIAKKVWTKRRENQAKKAN